MAAVIENLKEGNESTFEDVVGMKRKIYECKDGEREEWWNFLKCNLFFGNDMIFYY